MSESEAFNSDNSEGALESIQRILMTDPGLLWYCSKIELRTELQLYSYGTHGSGFGLFIPTLAELITCISGHIWSEFLKVWLALTTANYHRNV